MRRRRRSELLPPDRGLQARMVLAMVVTPLVAVGGLVAVVVLWPRAVLPLLIVSGAGVAQRGRRGRPRSRRSLGDEEFPHLHAIVERLCVLADLPKPKLVVEREEQPNSWIEAPKHMPPRLHLTSGLILLLPDDELEAVIAHELSHLAHHDARIMGVVGGVGEVLAAGASHSADHNWFMWAGILPAAVIGWVSRLGALSFARHRELVADTGSAALTGRPAVLAAALRRISGELARLPTVDLRGAAARDMLHLVPVEPELERSRLLRTHPTVAQRIERLERMERAMHAARPAPR